MINKVIVTQNKVTVVTVGTPGPPGATVYYNFIDYTLNSDGTGTKNVDYGIGATITPERLLQGKYRLTSNIATFLNSRIIVCVLNDDNTATHIIPKYKVISDVILEISCPDYEGGEGFIDCDLGIVIQKLKS
jgi:hypothetical protein